MSFHFIYIYLDESCSSDVAWLGGDWFSVLIPWLWWLLFMWLVSLLLCCPTVSVLLWITPEFVELWLSFVCCWCCCCGWWCGCWCCCMRFNESGCVDDVETVVMFKSVNRVSYIEYGDLKISHPINEVYRNEVNKNEWIEWIIEITS